MAMALATPAMMIVCMTKFVDDVAATVGNYFVISNRLAWPQIAVDMRAPDQRHRRCGLLDGLQWKTAYLLEPRPLQKLR